jgi:F-box and WD-40 domain protein CDC4
MDVQNGGFVRDLLTNLSAMWVVKCDERRCVAAVKRNQTYIEVSNFVCAGNGTKTDLDKVLDFDASRDGYPENKYLRRTVVDALGREVSDAVRTVKVWNDSLKYYSRLGNRISVE